MEKKDINGGAKSVSGGAKLANDHQELLREQNPNCDNTNRSNSGSDDHVEEEGQGEQGGGQEDEEAPRQSSSGRTPFTNLNQIDADLALARRLQEQERAYMMLRMNAEGSDYGSWEEASYEDDDFGDPDDADHDADDDGDEEEEGEEEEEEEDGDVEHEDEHDLDHDHDHVNDHNHEFDESEGEDDGDAFDVHGDAEFAEEDQTALELDPGMFSSDEAYARALQDAEERDMAARLFALAGINDRRIIGMEYHGNHQDAWEEVDPDELSYEELIALGEAVGTESRGLSADTIASLPSINYKAESGQNGSNESCVICRLDYEEGETLTALSCKHTYHPECINNWLEINKVCPVCSTEVSTSGHS